MRVRRAVVDDADAIERVRTDTWRDAYRGLMPDSLLDRLGYDATRRRARMSALPAHQFVLVAEDDGTVVGFCIGGRSRPPKERFRGEVYASMSCRSSTAAAPVGRCCRPRRSSSSTAASRR